METNTQKPDSPRPLKGGEEPLDPASCSLTALDLFCCAGGAGMGLHQAGFTVHGVDKEEQPDYPFSFEVGDALEADLSRYDLVWASPPCQCFTKYGNVRKDLSEKYEDLISATREKLTSWGGNWIMENVVGAPLDNPVTLCGSMFGLDVMRHRLFESNMMFLAPPCDHSMWEKNRFPGGRSVERGGRSDFPCRSTMEIGSWDIPFEDQKKAMGMPWVTDLRKLSQAIPPEYSRFLGERAAEILRENARAEANPSER